MGRFGTILRTTDGGVNWKRQSSGTDAPLLGVSFADAKHGTVVGVGGKILWTSDVGESWAAAAAHAWRQEIAGLED